MKLIPLFLLSDVDEWDKWEDDGHTPVSKPAVNWSPKIDQVGDTARDIEVERSVQSDIDMLLKNVQDLDILKLGNTPKVKVKDEVDFFADMTPEIPSKMSELEKFQLELEKTKQVKKIFICGFFLYLFTTNMQMCCFG